MTHKERIWRAIRGEPLDHIPWVPCLRMWHAAKETSGTMPEAFRGMGLFDTCRALGVGINGRHGGLFRRELRRVEVRVRTKGQDTLTEYITPVGAVSTLFRSTPELEAQGVQGREIEHLVKCREDYAPVLFMVENTDIVPIYQDEATKEEIDDLNFRSVNPPFIAYEARIGEDGIALADTGICPAHRLMREFTGYQNFYYELYDHPREVEELLSALTEEGRRIQVLALECPAQIIRHDGNFDAQLTPPPIFARYFVPYHREFADKLHAQGKLFCTHGDGHNDGLLGLFLEAGFDICESFTPPPMTNIGLAQARRVWGDRMVIWGGLAANMFSATVAEEDFEAHLEAVFGEMAPGARLILGIGDDFPTDGLLPRLERVSELMEAQERYPR